MTEKTITYIQVATDSAFTNIIYGTSVEDTHQLTFPYGKFSRGKDLYYRILVDNTSTGQSVWSDPITIRSHAPKNIIGICLDTRSEIPTWVWINECGDKLISADIDTNPVFQKLESVALDIDRDPVSMIKIPKFYIRTSASGYDGTFSEGKKCWWISPEPFIGFNVHPAFKRSGTTLEHLYVSTYAAHEVMVDEKITFGSSPDQTMVFSDTLPQTNWEGTPSVLGTIIERVNNRNNDDSGVSGFSIPDIYDLSVLKLLFLLKHQGADVKRLYDLTENNAVYTVTGTSKKIILRGTKSDPQIVIDDLWGYRFPVKYLCANIDIDTVSLSVPYPATTAGDIALYKGRYYLPQQIQLPMTLSGPFVFCQYTKNFAVGEIIIDDVAHDLLELFIPSEFTSSSDDSSTRDGLVLDYHSIIDLVTGVPNSLPSGDAVGYHWFTAFGAVSTSSYTSEQGYSGMFSLQRYSWGSDSKMTIRLVKY